MGVHDSVLDNQNGTVEALDDNTYRLEVDIANAPGVQNQGGEYNWTVALVQIAPDYIDLNVQATPSRLRFEPEGGTDGNDGKPTPPEP